MRSIHEHRCIPFRRKQSWPCEPGPADRLRSAGVAPARGRRSRARPDVACRAPTHAPVLTAKLPWTASTNKAAARAASDHPRMLPTRRAGVGCLRSGVRCSWRSPWRSRVAEACARIAVSYVDNDLILWPYRRFRRPLLDRKEPGTLSSPTTSSPFPRSRSLSRT
jgi:hypothetical protein